MSKVIGSKSPLDTPKKVNMGSNLVPLRHYSLIEAVGHCSLILLTRTYISNVWLILQSLNPWAVR